MAKGVKKIKESETSNVLENHTSRDNNIICIKPNKMVNFNVSEWYEDTTPEDKQRNITWLWQDQKKTTVIKKTVKLANTPFGVNIPNELCGSYAFYLEATLFGVHDHKKTGLHVYGKCDQKITFSSWSKTKGAVDTSEISYGHNLFITIKTEGANGDILSIELYSEKNPQCIQTKSEKCIDGKIVDVKFSTLGYNFFIPGVNTLISGQNPQSEKFYIKVKDITGEYLKNASGNDRILSFSIANKVVQPVIEIPTNTAPLTIDTTPVEEIVRTEGIFAAYFAKEEFSLETAETAGQHTYIFKNPYSSINKDVIAPIIKKRVDAEVKADKKYAKLDDIKNALTTGPYAIGDPVSFNLCKLGANYIKINNAPLEEEVYVVAKTFLLDGKEVSITIKEKETILVGENADMTVLEAKENGEELTILKATVENGIAKVKVKLRPKADEDLKIWKEKLLKGKKEEAYTYTFKSEETTITVDNKKEFAAIILKNAKEGKQGNTKIAAGKTVFVDDVEKALENKTYKGGDPITFDTYKTQAESLWLKAECQGETVKHEGEFLKRDGEYFVIGNGKCPRCEEEITLKQIEDLFGVHSRSKAFREDVVKYLNQFIKQRKNTDKPIHLNTCLRKAHFFAQVGAETSGINTDWIIESDVIPYTPTNIRDTSIFGDRTGILERRRQIETFCDERPQKKLLNFLYASENGNGNGNGNEASGDGYKYRGRGLKQLTGKDNYITASTTFQDIFPDEYVDLEINPDKVKEAKYAVLSAIAYWEKNEIWKTADNLKESTDANIKKIRRMVNGGLAGWSKAKSFYEKGIQVFKVNNCSPVKSSSGEWRNPVDNPQITIYTQGGLKRPWRSAFGNVRTDLRARDGVSPRPHHGLDLFAEIGTSVYACLPGKVVSLTPGTGYGRGFVLKVDSAYLESFKTQRRDYDPYYIKSQRSYNSNEYNIAGYGDFTEYVGITDSEEVYFMYAHLSEVIVALNEEITIDNYKTKILGKTGDTGASGTKGPHLHFEIRSKLNPSGYPERYNPAFYVNYKNEEQLTNTEKDKQDQTANN